ncbi:hypothetical protein S40285_01011 [Stachybotrys chlorohalonatus IBT 40285]|uniref:FAM192A/Fyv6 N-terminal domain-containing protein n=1 Tax=Stachybotrys chlorohalonatus (strain IBT 40285) TaxID=1283841 RepID=A0A084QKF7_STAC4|nr:hypothetical protein S40285_01011 [Stachybotrys chlorohalonata IBT 40285]
MAGRFVSGGTISSTGEISDPKATETPQHQANESTKNKEWEAVQKELELERKRREEQRAKAATGEEKSLYDILQENKGLFTLSSQASIIISWLSDTGFLAAKQAAFEEQTKVRNQFRALDDDEIDFLDEVRERRRKEEDEVRRQTEEGLKAFRERQQQSSGGGATATAAAREDEDTEAWAAGRKRKRNKERDIKGVKRKSSESEETKVKELSSAAVDQVLPSKAEASQEKTKKGLSLVDYGSDNSDDD